MYSQNMWHPLNNVVLRIQKSDVGLTNRFVVPILKQNMNENIYWVIYVSPLLPRTKIYVLTCIKLGNCSLRMCIYNKEPILKQQW